MPDLAVPNLTQPKTLLRQTTPDHATPHQAQPKTLSGAETNPAIPNPARPYRTTPDLKNLLRLDPFEAYYLECAV
jgi:hypothetical protein